ncbi:MAG: hypothetical protein IJX84_04105 [Clostridia bacterium]|nr:hypothetical protein [Clostridia bacterium]
MKRHLLFIILVFALLALSGCQSAQDRKNEEIYMEAYNITYNNALFYHGTIENDFQQQKYDTIQKVLSLLKQLPPDYTRGTITVQDTIDSIEQSLQSPMIGNWKCYTKNSSIDTIFEFRLSISAHVSTKRSFTKDYKENVPVIWCDLDADNKVYLDGDYFYTPDISDKVNSDYWMEDQQLIRQDHARAKYRYDRTDTSFNYLSAKKYVQVID